MTYDCALVGSNNSARAGSLYGSLNPGEAFKRSYYCALVSSNDSGCAASLNGSLQSSFNGCLDATTVQPHTVWGLALHSYFEYTRSHLEFTSMVSDLITFKAYFFAVPSEVFFRCRALVYWNLCFLWKHIPFVDLGYPIFNIELCYQNATVGLCSLSVGLTKPHIYNYVVSMLETCFKSWFGPANDALRVCY